jgi:hypothetical protein
MCGLGVSCLVPLPFLEIEAAAANLRGIQRPKSLVVLWLAGGPSQLETWDPHPNTKIGGPTRSIRTTIPDVAIAEHFPQVAEQLHHLSVVRSLVSKEGDHDRATYAVRTGYRPDQSLRHPFVGSIVAKELPNAQLELPPVISLGYHHEHDRPRGGYLGANYDAFAVLEPGLPDESSAHRVQHDREQRRLNNLRVVANAFQRQRRTIVDRTMHQASIDAAVKMMNSEQQEAFRLDEESLATRQAYGDSNFGRGCLVARRLVEQGVRAIEVVHENYDSHSNNFETHRNNAKVLDPAFASLVRDLHARDLLDSTVVLCIGEFGRTPLINRSDGRDHWPAGFSCVVGGGGLRPGHAVGETDPSGDRMEPASSVEVADLFATIFRAMGIDPVHQVATPIGRPIRYSSGTSIRQLLE